MFLIKGVRGAAAIALCCFFLCSNVMADEVEKTKAATFNSTVDSQNANTNGSLSVEKKKSSTSEKKTDSLPMLLKQYVVTADKMNTDVQSLPSSVTVLSADSMETRNITSTKDIFTTAPNMYYIKSGTDAYVGDSFASIRGITSFMSGAPVLGVYVDDVYLPGYEIPLFDIEKTEVLRGPQATLYGRNSQGGVISIYTKEPSRTEWEGKVAQTFGNYNTSTSTGLISGPIDDDWSMRAGAQYEYTDGFSRNYDGDRDINKHRNWSAQGAVDWHPNDSFKFTLNLDGQDYDGNNAELQDYSSIQSSAHEVDVDWAGVARKLAGGVSGRAEYKFNSMKFLSITAVRQTNTQSDQDMDFTRQDITRYDIDISNSLITQEFRLQSDDKKDKLQWLVGSFLFSEDEDLRYEYLAGKDDPTVPGEHYRQDGDTDTKGFAFFGQGVYALGDLDITLGLRYDYESKSFDYEHWASAGMITNWGMTNVSGDANNSYGVWLPKVALGWHATDNIMPYASISRGYRSGGFNLTQTPGKAYDPEFTWNYEAGLKTTWLDKTLKFNLAMFYIDWTDIQVMQPQFPDFTITNAGKAVSEGFEVETSWLPVPSLELFANAGYTHAYFTDYSDDAGDYSNKNVTNVPEYTVSAGATYRFLEHFMINGDYSAVGPMYYDAANTVRQNLYHLVNAKVGYEGDQFDFYVWGKNLLNQKYATRAFEMDAQWYGRAGDPLTVGFTLDYRF
jgi:iron complex outermembrane receptor protein